MEVEEKAPSAPETEVVSKDNDLVNTSGHVQEMDRSFGLFSACAMAVLSDNAWGAGAGSLVIS